MGMNRRNVRYIGPYNPRHLFPLVDDKLQTKNMAIEHDVTVPPLLGVIDNQYDINSLTRVMTLSNGFCVKPAKCSGGKGILVIQAIEDGLFVRTNGQKMPLKDVQRHISNILAGLFSLGGAADVAMFEQCICPDATLKSYSHEGVPDIRVIVFRGVPIMAMTRLSCSESGGKANLHQGAIGVGIRIDSGAAVSAVQHDKIVAVHPDNGRDLMALTVPYWDKILSLACACADMSGLGYLGVDLVIDKDLGPMLLELNARPGLSIQMANQQGLMPRLDKVECVKHIHRWTVDERMAFAKKHFS